MAKPVNTQILLDGQAILVNSSYTITLEQKVVSHHQLIITCPTESIEDPSGDFASKAKEYMGKRLTLLVNEDQLVFIGVVENVNIHKYDGGQGLFVITVYSPTLLMAHGKDSQSYEKKNLVDIIKEATQEYPSDSLKIVSKPVFKEAIPYTVQYKESDFDFMCRLAKRYGEWFYYDGEEVKFGGHDNTSQPLIFGEDLSEFNFVMKVRPQNHTYLAYDSLEAKTHDSSSSDHKQNVSNPYISSTTQASSKLFAKKPTSLYNHTLLENGKSELDSVLKLKAQHALNTLVFNGKSDEPKVAIGSVIEVTGKNTEVAGQTDTYGSYIITSITHSINNSGEYINSFEGVPVDIKVPIYFDEDAVPVCEEQYAIVKDNNDPQGLGRVRVQFPWQAIKNQLSPWISLTTPHAGSEKGMYFIPEIGEEVLVGFENKSAEKPFVMGSRYNGGEKTPRKDPEQKIIQTKSGCTIILNDTEGSITIIDKDGSVINMDGAGGMTMKSSKTIVLQSDSIGLSANTIAITGTKQVSIGSDKVVAISSKKDIVTNAKNVNTTADVKFELGGKQIVTNSTADTLISGALVKINS
ncbi:contractile injection system protein, VgrG/Pvc8 family (plasmid) [Bernardetia sp. Wsw4-3y2]|uniref:type VI secretion system Vgr family protein n=1 Tax=Bernardetia sp. Wsw4-3y2 TaxID=3127471 RepID=UPI0030D19995